MSPPVRIPGSFRDPSGFLFRDEGALYRQVNQTFDGEYRAFMESGLYDELVADRLLVPHRETDHPAITTEGARVLEPELVPFISYPCEWCFSQLKDAAELTLSIMQRALAKGFWLKDASATNIQFVAAAKNPPRSHPKDGLAFKDELIEKFKQRLLPRR